MSRAPAPPRSAFPSAAYPTNPAGTQSSAFAQSDLAPPLRPERSTRRPIGATPSPASVGGNDSGKFDDPGSQAGLQSRGAGRGGGAGQGASGAPPQIGVTRFDDRLPSEGKNRRMMDQLNGTTNASLGAGGSGTGGDSAPNSPSMSPQVPSTGAFAQTQGRLSPNAPRTQYRSARGDDDSDADSNASSRPHSPTGQRPSDSPPLMVPSALQDAISAFSNAGRRAGGRRGGLADQGIGGKDGGGASGSTHPGRKQPISSALNPDDYPDTPAFREVDDVLRKVATEWPALARGTSVATEEVAEDFDPVSLALHLLDPASSRERDPSAARQSLSSFLRLKAELDHAIRSTLSPQLNPSVTSSNAYRAYETSITTHNMTLGALGVAQKQIGGLKTGLQGTREMLEGKGREGLAGMYARMGMLEEMSSVLDEIDHLLRLPPSLESLLSEKRFLSAVVLLMRSIKTLNKPEMQEIGALADLRAWAQGQETVMLEILIEELHNHLYLKSFYCDVRWKSYTRGQTSLPVVDFGDDADVPSSIPSHLAPSFHSSGRSTARLPRMSKLQRFLQSLALKPSSNPMLDEAVEELMLVADEAEEDASGLGTTGSFSFGAGESLSSMADGSGQSGVAGGSSAKASRQSRRNPEVDSFAYLEMLMESLAALGKLGYALDAVGQRVQGEMFALVESTVEEVEERNDRSRAMYGGGASTGGGSGSIRPPSTFLPSSPDPNNTSSAASAAAAAGTWATEGVASLLRLSASETSSLASSVETLRDLFWTLYSKLDAVLQGFRVAYEVAGRIAERRDFKDASLVKTSSGNLLFSLLDVWKPVQQEVRALLHDYLQDDESGTISSRNPIVSVNEVLRFPKPRDTTKQIFKFSDSDLETTTRTLKTHEDSLNKALKAAVPGLITDGAPSTTTTSALIVASADFSSGTGRASGLNGTHKALVPADAFNVSVLFGPTLAFLDRVKEIMPGGLVNDEETNASTSFGGFLDEFVLRTFLPQLEDKVASVFHQAVGGIDAFQEDPNWKRVSKVPIVRSVSSLILLISSLTLMLRATPFHRDNYSQLIVGVVHQFYQRCFERFKDIVSRETHDSSSTTSGPNGIGPSRPAPLKTAADWAGSQDLYAVLQELQETPETENARVRELLAKETKLELDRKRTAIVEVDDLISPSKKLWALATLYSSLDWFINRISLLNAATESSTAPVSPIASLGMFAGARRGARESGYSSSDGSPAPAGREDGDDGDERESSRGRGMPLTGDMARPFDALLKAYRRLASMILFTLRLEIRLRTMHYLDKATRDGVYQLSEDSQEPDPSVVDLNGDLALVDEVAAGALGVDERKFIFAGVSQLMDQLLVTNARHIRLANQFGLSKMNRNILALQQNLKNIGDEPLEVDFDRSRKFWELFGKGPRAMLDTISTGTVSFSFDDYKTLLQLQLEIDQSGKDAIGGAGTGGATDSMIGPPMSATSDKNRRAYGEYMIELFSLDNGNDGDE